MYWQLITVTWKDLVQVITFYKLVVFHKERGFDVLFAYNVNRHEASFFKVGREGDRAKQKKAKATSQIPDNSNMCGGVWSKPIPSISLSIRYMVPCSLNFMIC